MRTSNVILLSFLLLVAVPAVSQDSAMVKKPSPAMRANDQMPVRKGKGTSRPMPSPQYRSRMVPMPTDTNRTRPRLDTTR